jgi:hypothetical protein
MTAQLLPTEQLKQMFHQRPCWILADLARPLDYALISVRRFLTQIGYYRSYTHNGKWYTLRHTPQFNREGLWHHRDIGFSRHGSLTATICHLVGRGPAGLSARELAQNLQHPCHAVLTHLHQERKLDRLKIQGEFRYFSIEAPRNGQQRESAGVLALPSSASSASLSTQAALLVLVEYIKNPELSFEQLAARLPPQGPQVTPDQIRRFFAEHALKKTPETPRHKP